MTMKRTFEWSHRRYRRVNIQDFLPWDICKSRSRIDQPMIGRPLSFSSSTGTSIIIIIFIFLLIIIIITFTTAVVVPPLSSHERTKRRRRAGVQKDTWLTMNLRTRTHAQHHDRSMQHRGCLLSLPPVEDHDGALYRDVTKQSRTTHTRAGWLTRISRRATSRRRPATAPRDARRRDAGVDGAGKIRDAERRPRG